MSGRLLILLFSFIWMCYAPPVRKQAEDPFEGTSIHYNQYLSEVLKELENDKQFSEQVKFASDHNRTAHIAESLSFVQHHIRNKLDEIKRREVSRLNVLEHELERRKREARGEKVPPPEPGLDATVNSFDKEHIDHSNPHSFEIADLEKLIRKTEEDLKVVDSEQEKTYKDHEMKKAHLRKMKVQAAKDAAEQAEIQKRFEDADKRHRNHSKVHQPGSEEQLKEVWEKEDHLDKDTFNPSSFFNMHDLNSDGHLDINEVEALMQGNLDKVYEENNTDDDMQERYHEMMRMRQEMMSLMDKDKDNLVSKEEFINYSSNSHFKDDPEWKTGEELPNKSYKDEEFSDYENDFGKFEQDEDDFSDMDDSLRHIPKMPPHAAPVPEANNDAPRHVPHHPDPVANTHPNPTKPTL